MSKYMSQYSVSSLLAKLSDKKLIKSDDENINNFVLEQQDKKSPLYLRGLIGFGAFIASLLFIFAFSFLMYPFHKYTWTLVGLSIVALAILLHKLNKSDNNEIKKILFNSFSLTSMATGKILFTTGMGNILYDIYWENLSWREADVLLLWSFTISFVIITAATYNIYRMSVDQFLSTVLVFFLIVFSYVVAIDLEMYSFSLPIFLGYMVLQIVGAAILITSVKTKRTHTPLLYGFLFSICTNVLYFTSQNILKFFDFYSREPISTIYLNLLFTVSLIASIAWIAGGVKDKLKSEPFFLACLGSVLLGLVSSPGIILSIILMILGYAKHEKTMITFGALLLPVFLYTYYHSLDVSLMQKSGVLIGSGVTLLIGRFYISFKGWNKEDTL